MKAIEECLPPEREEDIEKGGSQTETHVVGSLFVSIPTRVGSMRMVWSDLSIVGFPVRGLPRLCLSFRQRRRRKNIRGYFLNSKEDGHDRVWQESSLPFSKTTSRPPSLPKMKNSHPCYESAVKRNLRSLVDRHEPGESESLSVLSADLTSFHRKPISYSAYKKKWWTIFSALFDLP